MVGLHYAWNEGIWLFLVTGTINSMSHSKSVQLCIVNNMIFFLVFEFADLVAGEPFLYARRSHHEIDNSRNCIGL